MRKQKLHKVRCKRYRCRVKVLVTVGNTELKQTWQTGGFSDPMNPISMALGLKINLKLEQIKPLESTFRSSSSVMSTITPDCKI